MSGYRLTSCLWPAGSDINLLQLLSNSFQSVFQLLTVVFTRGSVLFATVTDGDAQTTGEKQPVLVWKHLTGSDCGQTIGCNNSFWTLSLSCWHKRHYFFFLWWAEVMCYCVRLLVCQVFSLQAGKLHDKAEVTLKHLVPPHYVFTLQHLNPCFMTRETSGGGQRSLLSVPELGTVGKNCENETLGC